MLVFEKKVPRPNVDEINGVPSYMTPHACTQDPRFFNHKLLSKSFEIKPQLMMAAATGLPSVGYKTWCACRQSVCSTIREVTNPLITKKPTDYRPSVSGPAYFEHFFLITCTTCFTRLLTSFRRFIQRLVSMSIADGLASTNLLLLYILAIYLHIYVFCFENTRYIRIRQRLLVTWCISHVRTSASIMFMVVRTHDRFHISQVTSKASW